MTPIVLVANPGSSSLKLSVVDSADEVREHVELDTRGAPGTPSWTRALEDFVDASAGFDIAVVRVVHGGPRLVDPLPVDDDVVAQVRDAVPLAPLHNPPALAAIGALRTRRAPVVAAFDGGFHATIPAAAATYAVPWDWTTRFGVRRIGFHGHSHRYVHRRVAALAGAAPARLVSCHLGSGSSLAAIVEGRSADTTMGFTPLEGLVMATRSGSVDPGIVLWAQRALGLDAAATEAALTEHGGLAALSGGSGALPDVLAAARGGDARAALAVEVLVHRVAAGVAAMTAAMGGLDAIAFTGGIGQHQPEIRAAVLGRLAHLGAAAGPQNAAGDADRAIGDPAAPVGAYALESREDLELARDARAVATERGLA